jgi:hypothetical protein
MAVRAPRRDRRWWSPSCGSGDLLGVDHAGEDVALDELLFATGGLAEGGGGEAINVAHATSASLVDHREGIGCEEVAVAAGAL